MSPTRCGGLQKEFIQDAIEVAIKSEVAFGFFVVWEEADKPKKEYIIEQIVEEVAHHKHRTSQDLQN